MKPRNNDFKQQHNLNAYRKQLLPKIQIFTSFSNAEPIVARCAIVLFWFHVGPVRPDSGRVDVFWEGAWLVARRRKHATSDKPTEWLESACCWSVTPESATTIFIWLIQIISNIVDRHLNITQRQSTWSAAHILIIMKIDWNYNVFGPRVARFLSSIASDSDDLVVIDFVDVVASSASSLLLQTERESVCPAHLRFCLPVFQFTRISWTRNCSA